MVLLIALLALARKVIVMDLVDVDTAQTGALAALVLALGVSYWLMRERDDRVAASPDGTGLSRTVSGEP
jgi:uncharacterized membrane protein (DUF373 family)